MLDRLYNISPAFIKRCWVLSFKTFRKILYTLNKNSEKKIFQSGNTDNEQYRQFQLSRRYGPLKHFCYAPYSSMFFSLHGKMAPCYATYNENSDVFPKISLSESWFHGHFNTIRKEHSNFNFNKNCKFCYTLFKNKTYNSMLLQKYEHYAFKKYKYPAIMEFELSNKCNLECIMCDANLSSSICKKTKSINNTEEIYNDEYLQQLEEFIPHLQMAEFTGGDPLIIEIYFKIWNLIAKINPKCKILITTNANTMNTRVEHLLKENTNINFNVSIDAITNPLYESIRINGNLEKALCNISILKEYCIKNKTELNLLVCPLTINIEEIPKLITFANENNFGIFFHTVVKPKHLSLKYEAPDKLEKHISFLKTYIFETKTFNQKRNTLNYKNLILLIESWKNENNKHLDTKKTTDMLEIVVKHIYAENNPELIAKTEQILTYFDNHKIPVNTLIKLNTLPEEFIRSMLLQKSVEEIIKFVEELT